MLTRGHSLSQPVAKSGLRRRRPRPPPRTLPCTGRCRSVSENPRYCLTASFLCAVSSRLSQGLGGAPFSRLHLASSIISGVTHAGRGRAFVVILLACEGKRSGLRLGSPTSQALLLLAFLGGLPGTDTDPLPSPA